MSGLLHGLLLGNEVLRGVGQWVGVVEVASRWDGLFSNAHGLVKFEGC